MDTITIILGIFALSFAVAFISAVNKIRKISETFAKLMVAQVKLDTFINNNPRTKQDQDIHKENFIKFLSDSRDWAFEYIEEVQSGLNKFIKEVEPELEYYNKYGIVIEGMVPPHDKALKKISKEFEQLKKLLPEEPSDRR